MTLGAHGKEGVKVEGEQSNLSEIFNYVSALRKLRYAPALGGTS